MEGLRRNKYGAGVGWEMADSVAELWGLLWLTSGTASGGRLAQEILGRSNMIEGSRLVESQELTQQVSVNSSLVKMSMLNHPCALTFFSVFRLFCLFCCAGSFGILQNSSTDFTS